MRMQSKTARHKRNDNMIILITPSDIVAVLTCERYASMRDMHNVTNNGHVQREKKEENNQSASALFRYFSAFCMRFLLSICYCHFIILLPIYCVPFVAIITTGEKKDTHTKPKLTFHSSALMAVVRILNRLWENLWNIQRLCTTFCLLNGWLHSIHTRIVFILEIVIVSL